MSGEKLLAAMRANPRDWRIADVERLCAAFSLRCSALRKGSHYKVSHPAMHAIITVPAHRPIKPVYVRELVQFVDAVREQSQ